MERLTDKMCDEIIDEIGLKQELEKLNNDELVSIAISKFTDWTWHPVIEVMMDRLSPGWDVDKPLQGEDKENG